MPKSLEQGRRGLPIPARRERILRLRLAGLRSDPAEGVAARECRPAIPGDLTRSGTPIGRQAVRIDLFEILINVRCCVETHPRNTPWQMWSSTPKVPVLCRGLCSLAWLTRCRRTPARHFPGDAAGTILVWQAMVRHVAAMARLLGFILNDRCLGPVLLWPTNMAMQLEVMVDGQSLDALFTPPCCLWWSVRPLVTDARLAQSRRCGRSSAWCPVTGLSLVSDRRDRSSGGRAPKLPNFEAPTESRLDIHGVERRFRQVLPGVSATRDALTRRG